MRAVAGLWLGMGAVVVGIAQARGLALAEVALALLAEMA